LQCLLFITKSDDVTLLQKIQQITKYFLQYMVATINKVILIGNVGRDPDIKITQNQTEIASFSIATSDSWKDKHTGERREKTEWHRIVVLSPNIVPIIKDRVSKGKKVYIEGSLQTRKWTDSSGMEKYTTEVVVQSFGSTVIVLDSNSDRDSGGEFTSNSFDNNSFTSGTDNTTYGVNDLQDNIPY